MAADTLITLAEPVELRVPPSGAAVLWSAFSENRGAVVGAAVALLIVLVAIFAPLLAPHSPIEQFREAVMAPPFWDGGSWRFPLGTDGEGRDLLSRLIYGARVSLLIGMSVMLVSFGLGIVLGLAAAFNNIVDVLVTRVMDIIMAVPDLVLAILAVAILGPNLINTIIAITIVFLPRYVRLVRASALGELDKDYGDGGAGVGRRPAAPGFRHRPAELPRSLDRAGGTRRIGRDSRGGGTGLPRPRGTASDPGVGRHAGRRPPVHPLATLDRDPARAWRSWLRWWRSTSPVTGCATPSTPR